ncbi:DNA-binding transcriptional regulator YafC [Chimaeribacter arupi]|uniref:LysR family transcriptional regulator n=1 Tax=Chimaeribacter arupi TaxID=2060066 RepID=A0A2N5ENQ7_9GAMM|nr:DNA-binding transcriptional regulator YafC [Chimaeribacter arupi]PLR36068.1 LysR family transcriptional regulator [Chimaeribacter arupi]PLR50581.1 LysR family transcriptional regulator [Chimaeribacter arupi]
MRATSDELMAFVTVVECGSFSKAAAQLEQDNSVVSRMVKRLEQKLGVTLLNRTTRQISLTHEGEIYFRRVQRVLHEMAAAENELLDNREAPQGLLRVDAATPVILHMVTPLVSAFTQRYPQIELSLVASESYINLIERKVDIAIRFGELGDSSLRARKLMVSYRRIIASPDYLMRHGMPMTPDDLLQHHCLGFNEVIALNRWPLLYRDGQQVEVTPSMTANNGETLRQLALHGNGVACLSDYLIQDDLNHGRLVEILQDHLLQVAIPIHAVYYSDQSVSSRIRCFIDFLAEHLPSRIGQAMRD